MVLSDAYYRQVETRIGRLTLIVSTAGAAYFGVQWGWRAGVGVALGGVLSWLNFRWLDDVVSALFEATLNSNAGSESRLSRWIYARFVGRLALMVGGVYVILKSPWVPGRAVLAGLFSLIAAVLLEVMYEVGTGFREPDSRGPLN